ncbi:hypothetical protein LA5094_02357 [Roseibium album]|nr:hypothetical protein LA5094_02357 [Roseibium album]
MKHQGWKERGLPESAGSVRHRAIPGDGARKARFARLLLKEAAVRCVSPQHSGFHAEAFSVLQRLEPLLRLRGDQQQ